MNKIYLLPLLALLVLVGCKSASKAYESGDYQGAISRSLKKLQKDPYDYDAQDVLKKAYAYAVTRHQDEIRILAASSSENRYEQIYYQYSTLQDLYRGIRDIPSAEKAVKPTDYSSYLETYKGKIADMHVEKGDTRMKEGTRRGAREAYNQYRQALTHRPESMVIKDKVEDAYEAAVVDVLLLPTNTYTGNVNSYEVRNFQNRIISQLANNSTYQFIRYFSEADLKAKKIKPMEIVEVQLSHLDIGRAFDESSSREVSKEVVTKETVYKPDSIVKQTSTVKAKIITTKRTVVSMGDVVLTARDSLGKVVWTEVVKGEHKWETRFATYNGDERALSDTDMNLVNSKEQKAPSESTVINEVLRQLGTNLSSRLQNHYSRYSEL
ncbi:MAG TPA: hypothetical protein VGE66_03435 [Chitinophagaceae bacterium]